MKFYKDKTTEALDQAKAIVVRLRALRDAQDHMKFNDLRRAAQHDVNHLDYLIQTLPVA